MPGHQDCLDIINCRLARDWKPQTPAFFPKEMILLCISIFPWFWFSFVFKEQTLKLFFSETNRNKTGLNEIASNLDFKFQAKIPGHDIFNTKS